MAKMANFMEVDVFVLVACPENTLIDSKVCHYINCDLNTGSLDIIQ